jgi:carbon storage regulator CsrA
MLIISRKKDQKIIVADDIEITILEVGRNRVRFGIKAPKHIPIQTRLKTTPNPEKATQPVGVGAEASPSSLVELSAAVSLSKRR